MTGRRQRRARRRAAHAQAKGDEPPDPVTATIAAAVIGAGATLGSTAIAKAGSKPKAVKPVSTPQLTPAEDTTLKPGQRADLISTGPSGILDPANTGRKTLLGN